MKFQCRFIYIVPGKVLSQDEIDQLLSAISAGEISTEEIHQPRDQRKIKIYDFKRPDKFSKDQIRTVSIMHETFARLTTTSMSAQLRSLVHVHVASVDQLTYEEFIRSIPNPTTLAVIDMDPLKGSAILEIDPAITFSVIDRLFGGQGEGAKFSRDLTDIEQAVMEGIIVRVLGNLRESWSTVIDLRPRLGGIETNPQFASVVAPTEVVIVIKFEVELEQAVGTLIICLPYSTIEPIRFKLYAGFQSDQLEVDHAWIDRFIDQVRQAEVELSVELGRAKLTPNELLRLKTGDIIQDTAVTILIEEGTNTRRSQTICITFFS